MVPWVVGNTSTSCTVIAIFKHFDGPYSWYFRCYACMIRLHLSILAQIGSSDLGVSLCSLGMIKLRLQILKKNVLHLWISVLFSFFVHILVFSYYLQLVGNCSEGLRRATFIARVAEERAKYPTYRSLVFSYAKDCLLFWFLQNLHRKHDWVVKMQSLHVVFLFGGKPLWRCLIHTIFATWRISNTSYRHNWTKI